MGSIQFTHINRTSLIVEQHVSVLGRSFGKVANHSERTQPITVSVKKPYAILYGTV